MNALVSYLFPSFSSPTDAANLPTSSPNNRTSPSRRRRTSPGRRSADPSSSSSASSSPSSSPSGHSQDRSHPRPYPRPDRHRPPPTLITIEEIDSACGSSSSLYGSSAPSQGLEGGSRSRGGSSASSHHHHHNSSRRGSSALSLPEGMVLSSDLGHGEVEGDGLDTTTLGLDPDMDTDLTPQPDGHLASMDHPGSTDKSRSPKRTRHTDRELTPKRSRGRGGLSLTSTSRGGMHGLGIRRSPNGSPVDLPGDEGAQARQGDLQLDLGRGMPPDAEAWGPPQVEVLEISAPGVIDREVQAEGSGSHSHRIHGQEGYEDLDGDEGAAVFGGQAIRSGSRSSSRSRKARFAVQHGGDKVIQVIARHIDLPASPSQTPLQAAEYFSNRSPHSTTTNRRAHATETTSLLSHASTSATAVGEDGEEAKPLLPWHKRPLFVAGVQLSVLFAVFTVVMLVTIWWGVPPLEGDDRDKLKLPRSFADLQALNALFQKYKKLYPFRLLAIGVVGYLYVQTFSLPGSMYISILFGAAYGMFYGLVLSCLCEATGAVFCYSLSAALGPPLLEIPAYRSRLEFWRTKIMGDKSKGEQVGWDGVFAFLIVLRIAPFPPHWIANVVAPHLDISPALFWLACFIGIAPVSVIHVTIGSGLDQMTSADDFHILSLRNVLGLIGVGVAVMIPVGLKRVFKKDLSNLNDAEDILNQPTIQVHPPLAEDGLTSPLRSIGENYFTTDGMISYQAQDSGVVLSPPRGMGSHPGDDRLLYSPYKGKGKGRAVNLEEALSALRDEEGEEVLAVVYEGEAEGGEIVEGLYKGGVGKVLPGSPTSSLGDEDGMDENGDAGGEDMTRSIGSLKTRSPMRGYGTIGDDDDGRSVRSGRFAAWRDEEAQEGEKKRPWWAVWRTGPREV